MLIYFLGRIFMPAVLPLMETVINAMMYLQFGVNSNDYTEAEKIPKNEQYFDFIVVGSGSAGAVVGGRLSEIPDWQVLVLEAGEAPGPRLAVPISYVTSFSSKEDWQYTTVPQKHSAFGNTDHRIPIPRGKAIGGCSATNGMLYVRGNPLDFDQWAGLGNVGWDYRSVLPFFKKSEHVTGDIDSVDAKYRGFNGPMSITVQKVKTHFQKIVVQAGKELGYKLTDVNGKIQTGITTLDLCVKNGERQSSADAFLRPHLYRKNLHITTKAFVTKVLFDDNNKAIGVQYVRDGKKKTAYARKEVILSAGAISSPQLLMLSGIGPKEHLEYHKVPVRVDIPGMGQNLMDHMGIFGGLTFFKGKLKGRQIHDIINPEHVLPYKLNREGIFGSVTALEMTGLHSLTADEPTWPDLDIQFMSKSVISDFGFSFYNSTGFDEKFFLDYFGHLLHHRTLNLNPSLLRPKSRGYLKLKSNNPFDHPIIDTNTLSHPDDVELMVKGVKLVLRFTQTKAFRAMGITFYDKPLKNCKHHLMYSDDYWRCYVRHFTTSFHHASGTCKMAPETDPFRVVDPRLRVYGTKNLRVIDASIMPVIVTGNTHASSVMIGEKGADMVKKDWGILH